MINTATRQECLASCVSACIRGTCSQSKKLSEFPPDDKPHLNHARCCLPTLVPLMFCMKRAYYFRRRERLVRDLLKDGIGSIIIESPYYGFRKPSEQEHSKLLHVSDLIKLGAATIVEGLWFVHMLRAAGLSKVCTSQ